MPSSLDDPTLEIDPCPRLLGEIVRRQVSLGKLSAESIEEDLAVREEDPKGFRGSGWGFRAF